MGNHVLLLENEAIKKPFNHLTNTMVWEKYYSFFYIFFLNYFYWLRIYFYSFFLWNIVDCHSVFSYGFYFATMFFHKVFFPFFFYVFFSKFIFIVFLENIGDCNSLSPCDFFFMFFFISPRQRTCMPQTRCNARAWHLVPTSACEINNNKESKIH